MILAIETATAVCGVALVHGGRIVAESSLEAVQMHAEKLAPMIEDIVAAHVPDPSLIDAVAVSIGPGSFTGLRIGLSGAKGLAYAWEKPLVAVPTLEAIALRAGESSGDMFVLPMIAARRDEVYAALYHLEAGALELVRPSRAIDRGAIGEMLPAEGKVVVMGDGADAWRSPDGGEKGRIEYIVPGRAARICSPAAVANAAEIRFRRGELADLASLEPMYLKEFFTTMNVS